MVLYLVLASYKEGRFQKKLSAQSNAMCFAFCENILVEIYIMPMLKGEKTS